MVPCTVMGDIISTHKVICSLNIKDFWIFLVKIFKIAEYTSGATFEDMEMWHARAANRLIGEVVQCTIMVHGWKRLLAHLRHN